MYRRIYTPFWSFAEIAAGNRRVIFETAANIILFLPFGFFYRQMFGWSRRKTIYIGFCVSLLIEVSQWIFRLGETEVDDLITNTLGTAIGALVLVSGRKRSNIAKKIAIISFFIALILPPVLQDLWHLHMQHLASYYDRADGTKNLLVLDGDPGFAGNSDVFVYYRLDGSIIIKGSSNIRTWKRIGTLTLEPGTYSFSGLSGTNPKTISIVLEIYDKENKKSTRLTADVGPISETSFSLSEEKTIRAYVSVYPGAEGEYTARPVIYREE